MKFKVVLTVIAFSLLFGSTEGVRYVSVHASDKPTVTAEPASAQGANRSPVTEDNSSKAGVHFEPLLLLLLGSTLFSLGTTIKLVLSRKLDPKPLAAARKPPSPQC